MLTGVVQNHRVLELGSGAGFLGLVMAALQMERNCSTRTALVLSDVNPEVLSRCRQNFHLPCSEYTQLRSLTSPHLTRGFSDRTVRHSSLDFRLLDWSDALDSHNNHLDPKSPIMEALNGIDTIIGADLVRTLISTLQASFASTL